MGEKTKLLHSIVCCWLRFRYGGNVFALKNPIGYHRIIPKTVWWIAIYKVRVAIWLIEKWLFNRYGQEMRDKWNQSFKCELEQIRSPRPAPLPSDGGDLPNG